MANLYGTVAVLFAKPERSEVCQHARGVAIGLHFDRTAKAVQVDDLTAFQIWLFHTVLQTISAVSIPQKGEKCNRPTAFLSLRRQKIGLRAKIYKISIVSAAPMRYNEGNV